MNIDRMKQLAGVREAKKPQGSTLSLHDIDGMTVGDLIRHLQSFYDPTDRIVIEEEYEYRMIGGSDESTNVIKIYPGSS